MIIIITSCSFILSVIILFIGIQDFVEAKTCSHFHQNMCTSSGTCIDSDQFCDGAIDCSDGSDESAAECLHLKCPRFSFQCTYGACVRENAKCDGKNDCADESDENPLLCDYNSTLRERILMKKDIFVCDNGDSITLADACDGHKDCTDGSDEVVQLCSSTQCPAYAFRCGYGACISPDKKCDKVKDCADGSDELNNICGWNITKEDNSSSTTMVTTAESTAIQLSTKKPLLTTTESSIPTTMRSSTILTTTTPKTFTSSACQFDDIPDLFATIEPTGEKIQHGDFVDEFVMIKYRCRPKHLLEGSHSNLCFGGIWAFDHPKCTKYCASNHLKGVTFQAECNYQNVRIDCDQPLKIGTRAKITCNLGYKMPDRIVKDILYCDEYGEWDYSPFQCEAECGTVQTEATPFIIGGDFMNITSVPWHVGIYFLNGNSYEYICGGTIISAKIVISAAHCFWNTREAKPHHCSKFSVAVGKYFRDYVADESLAVQYFNVSELYIPPGYHDASLAYQDDIALLILNNFIAFKSYIKPICIEWYNYSEKSIHSGIVGRVSGWGKSMPGVKSSKELRAVDIMAISYRDCIQGVQPQYRFSITGDKFCIRSQNGESVCTGDSGAGFVTSKIIHGIKTYFLWGVVSNGLTLNPECNEDFYTAMTNIQFHQAMIMEYEMKYRPK